MGALAWASAAPVLIFGLFSGAWADRLRRRPILIAADVGRAAVPAVIPLAAMLGPLTIVRIGRRGVKLDWKLWKKRFSAKRTIPD
jgi:hypothetical protein